METLQPLKLEARQLAPPQPMHDEPRTLPWQRRTSVVLEEERLDVHSNDNGLVAGTGRLKANSTATQQPDQPFRCPLVNVLAPPMELRPDSVSKHARRPVALF